MPELDGIGVVLIHLGKQVDKMGLTIIAPFGTKSQCKVSVLRHRHPVIDYLYWVVAVDLVHLFSRTCDTLFGENAVNPVHLHLFPGPIILHVLIIDEID